MRARQTVRSCHAPAATIASTVAFAFVFVVAAAGPAPAANGDCAQPASNGETPVATDCLVILQTAVGLSSCTPECICAPSGSLPISASDALVCLNHSVGGALPLNCPCGSTTTSSTSSTTLPAPECPDALEFRIRAGVFGSCTTNADCDAGACDGALGRCRTETEGDSGQTGIGHDVDLNDGSLSRLALDCPASAPQPGKPCGVCDVLGVTPSHDNCRCADDNRQSCDSPFAADADDCGGGTCICYFGPPVATVAASQSTCVVNELASDVVGTVNVDTGDVELDSALGRRIFLTQSILLPCPVCDGDVTSGDGVRDGTCLGGENDLMPCDVQGSSTLFPPPGGGAGHSLDCFPTLAGEVTNGGITLPGLIGTRSTSLTWTLPCVAPNEGMLCACGTCAGDETVGCADNSDCAPGDSCEASATGQPNSCTNGVCVDGGSGQGTCETGPDDMYCDGLLRGDGEPLLTCQSDTVCENNQAGQCTLVRRRACFPDPTLLVGDADPLTPLLGSLTCAPPTGTALVDAFSGFPGLDRLLLRGVSRATCPPSGATVYTPGSGACF